jgi:glycosyltransferase involved in cell wall biosynthesis
MGRPIITTDAPGCRETVTEGENGFLVPPRDVAALADAVEKFLLDGALASTMGTASRRMAEERFDVDKVNDALLAFMELS